MPRCCLPSPWGFCTERTFIPIILLVSACVMAICCLTNTTFCLGSPKSWMGTGSKTGTGIIHSEEERLRSGGEWDKQVVRLLFRWFSETLRYLEHWVWWGVLMCSIAELQAKLELFIYILLCMEIVSGSQLKHWFLEKSLMFRPMLNLNERLKADCVTHQSPCDRTCTNLTYTFTRAPKQSAVRISVGLLP